MFVKTGYTTAKFLEHLLPDIQYIENSKRSKPATNFRNALRPDRIEKWDNFLVEARRYDLNCTNTFHEPRLEENMNASNEAGVDEAFIINVKSSIKTFF
jgi:hypothetical protein